MKMNFAGVLAVSVIAPSTLLAPIHLQASESTVPIYGTAQPAPPRPQAPIAKQANQKTTAPKSSTKPKEAAKSLPPPSNVTLNFVQSLRAGNMDMAKLLLQNGADINCRNCTRDGRTPLFAAYDHIFGHNTNAQMVWLLDNGADPDIPDNSGMTLLMHIASDKIKNPFYSGIEDFEYLLSRGAKAKVKDNKGDTVLHYLSANSIRDTEEMRNGGFGDSAYEMAKQWMRGFEKLIASGADINAVNKGGDTPLMYAAARCNPQVIETFLNNGADPSLRNKISQSPLQIATDVASKNSRQSCNRVVEILQSSPVARTTQPVSAAQKNTHALPFVESSSEWTGIFRATTPRRGDADVSVKIAPSGALTFKSSSGLQGSGEMSSQQGQISASVKAMSPKDANGKPVFGANEIVFNMTGHNENGVMKGEYKSIVESGTFILCSPEARQNGSKCNNPPSGNPLGGLLDTLRTLSGK